MDSSSEDEKLLLPNDRFLVQSSSYNSLGNPVNENDNDAKGSHIQTAKYVSRWYICGIFSLFGLMQGAIWNTWSPINESATCALGFSSGDIDLLTNWGPITFLIAMPIVMWMLDKKGMRLPNVLSASLVAAGTALRCLPLPTNILRYFIHAGQILNGLAGCAVMATPPMLSNAWFPPEERVTATSLTTLFNYFGTGVGYIVGPLLVRQPSENFSSNGSIFCTNHTERTAIRRDVMHLMYIEFAISLAIFISMIVYFPSHPPKPPSASAFASRMDFFPGLKALLHRRTFLIVTFTFSLVLGGYGGWTGVFSVILKPLAVSQDESANIGFFMTLAGCGIGLIVGWFADRVKGRIKILIIILYIISFLTYLYIINMAENWIQVPGFQRSRTGIWVACILNGVTLNAAVPLGMEMGADAAYPTSEAISASIIVWSFNLLSFVLLLVLQFTDPSVPNYLMLGFLGISIPLLIIFASEPSNRLRIDQQNSSDSMNEAREDGGNSIKT